MSLLPSFVFTKRVLGSLLMAGVLGSVGGDAGAAPALAQAQEQVRQEAEEALRNQALEAMEEALARPVARMA